MYLGSRIERCLSYDEKPLLLFQKLKDAQKNPVFMLKHIKDIRSPIAVAQQKQAARKASSSDPAAAAKKLGPGHARTLSRPPRLHVQSETALGSTGAGGHPGSPEVMSPAIDNREREDLSVDRLGLTPERKAVPGDRAGEAPKSAVPLTAVTAASTPEESSAGGTPAREVPVTSDISYAVAIYPYMAEQEDEFDVVV